MRGDAVRVLLQAAQLHPRPHPLGREGQAQRVEDAAPGGDVLRVVLAGEDAAVRPDRDAAFHPDARRVLVLRPGAGEDRLGLRVVGDAGAARFQAAGHAVVDPHVPAAAMQQVGREEPADRAADDDGAAAWGGRHLFPPADPWRSVRRQGSRLPPRRKRQGAWMARRSTPGQAPRRPALPEQHGQHRVQPHAALHRSPAAGRSRPIPGSPRPGRRPASPGPPIRPARPLRAVEPRRVDALGQAQAHQQRFPRAGRAGCSASSSVTAWPSRSTRASHSSGARWRRAASSAPVQHQPLMRARADAEIVAVAPIDQVVPALGAGLARSWRSRRAPGRSGPPPPPSPSTAAPPRRRPAGRRRRGHVRWRSACPARWSAGRARGGRRRAPAPAAARPARRPRPGPGRA